MPRFPHSARATALCSTVLLSALLSSCALSCSPGAMSGGERLLIMDYNVLSLFDGTDAGTEYSDFSVAKGSWSEGAYRRRLENLARVIRSAGPAFPDVVALQEIENKAVASDLGSLLAGEGLRYAAAAESGSATCCALLSRFPVLSVRSHLPPPGDGAAGAYRPILEALLDLGEGRGLLVFVNHWKSRLEGVAETEAARLAQARLLASLIAQRRRERPGDLVLACGDFNEDASGAAFALLGPDGKAVPRDAPLLLIPSAEAALASGFQEADAEGTSPLPLLSPWLDPGSEGGSYAYRGTWERIDMILAEAGSLASSGAALSSFGPSAAAFLLDQDGSPLAWETERGTGFSDHLPLFLSVGLGP